MKSKKSGFHHIGKLMGFRHEFITKMPSSVIHAFLFPYTITDIIIQPNTENFFRLRKKYSVKYPFFL